MKHVKRKVVSVMLVLTMALFVPGIMPSVFKTTLNQNGIAFTKVATAANMEMPVTYRIDINGDGKKEDIYHKNSTDGNEKVRAQIYINEKKELDKIYGLCNDSIGSSLEVIDLNKKDKYKDLCLSITGSSDYLLGFRIFQYKNHKLKQIGEFNNSNRNYKLIFGLDKVEKNGKLIFRGNSTFQNENLGTYPCLLPAKLAGTSIKFLSPKAYVIPPSKYKYILAKKVKLYSKSYRNSKFAILKKGSGLYIKPLKNKKDTNVAVFIYVNTSKGGKGWIYLPQKFDYNHPYFKNRNSAG